MIASRPSTRSMTAASSSVGGPPTTALLATVAPARLERGDGGGEVLVGAALRLAARLLQVDAARRDAGGGEHLAAGQ